jgi:hypothetical protein
MRIPLLLIGAALVAGAGVGTAAPRAQPPAAVRAAAAPLGCGSLTWTAWRGGWWLDCARTETTRRDGDVTVHRYVVVRDRAGRIAFEDLVETRASSSPRVQVPRREQVRVSGHRATYEARTEAGYVHRRVWDLATSPARLISDRDGGGKLCEDGFGATSSRVERPTCETDLVVQRQRCTTPRPVCGRDPVVIAPIRYTAIPLHDAAAPLRDPDLLHCATTIGDVGGKPAGAFQVVAVDDAGKDQLALHLRAPAPRDPWLLWLAPHDELTCDDTADLAAYCTRQPPVLAIAIAPAPDGAWTWRATTPSPPAGWASDVHAHGDGRDLVVELGGALRTWARDGGVSIGFRDARSGAQVATSPVQAERPETLGRLGTTLLCDRSDRP